MTDDRVFPLDPIYTGKNDEPISRNNDEHNTWRQHMPEHCWLCRNFDRCGPGHKCRHQVDIDVQAQLGVKGG